MWRGSCRAHLPTQTHTQTHTHTVSQIRRRNPRKHARVQECAYAVLISVRIPLLPLPLPLPSPSPSLPSLYHLSSAPQECTTDGLCRHVWEVVSVSRTPPTVPETFAASLAAANAAIHALAPWARSTGRQRQHQHSIVLSETGLSAALSQLRPPSSGFLAQG